MYISYETKRGFNFINVSTVENFYTYKSQVILCFPDSGVIKLDFLSKPNAVGFFRDMVDCIYLDKILVHSFFLEEEGSDES